MSVQGKEPRADGDAGDATGESIVASVMGASTTALTVDRIPSRVCESLARVPGVRRAALYRIGKGGIESVAGYSRKGAGLPRTAARLADLGVRAAHRFPVLDGKRTMGWLVAEPPPGRPLPPAARDACRILAPRMPSLLSMFGAFRQMEGRIRDLEGTIAVTHAAIDSSPAIIVTWGADPAFLVRFISRNIAQFGYSPKDFLSGRLNYAALIHPDDVPKMREHVARVKAAGQHEYTAHYRLRNARGEWRWVESHVVQEVRRRRPVELYHGVVLDITDRMSAEATSHLAARSFREIAETIHDIFFVMEYPTLRPLYCSPGAKAATGYTAAQITRDPELWLRTVHPQDRPAVARALQRDVRRGPVSVEFRMLHRDGSERWTEMHAAPVRDERARIVRITGLHRDIGDRRRADAERLRREKTEALISRVSGVLLPSRTGDIEDRIRRALGMVGQFLDIDRCVLRNLGPEGGVLSERAAWTRPGVAYVEHLARDIVLRKFDWGWRKLLHGEPVAIESVTDIPARLRPARALIREMGIRSFVFIPLIARGRLQAVMSFATLRHATRWTPTSIRLGRALGRMLLKTVQHAAAEIESRRREKMEGLVARVSALVAVRRGPALERAINRALEMTGRFLGVDRVVMVRRAPHADVYSEIGHWVRPGGTRERPAYRNAPVQALAHVWREIAAGRSVAVRTLGELPPQAAETRRLGESLGIRSAMFVPALAWNGTHALLYCSTLGSERSWQPDELRLGGTIGNAIIKAVQHDEAEANAREKDRVERLLTWASRNLLRARGRTLESRIRKALQSASHLLGADRAILSRRLPGSPVFTEVGSWTRPDLAERFPVYREAPVDRIAYIWKQISHGRDILARRLSDLPPEAGDIRTLFDSLGIRSFMLVPVMSWRGVHAGVYFATVERDAEWSATHVHLARTLGNLIVKAVHHSNAEDALRRRLAFESTVLSVSRRLVHAAADEIDEAIHQGLRQIGRALCVERTWVFRFSSDRRFFTESHEWCAPGVRSQQKDFAHIPVEAFPWTTRELLAGREVVIRTLDDYPADAEIERQLCVNERLHSIVFLPIMFGDRLAACIGWDALKEPRAWTEDELRVGRLASGVFASALARAWSEHALRASETRYRRFTADAPDAIYVLTADGRIRDANPAACLQTGLPLVTLAGRHIRSFLPSLDRRGLVQMGRRVGRDRAVRLTCPFRRADGRRIAAEVSANLLPEGEVLAFVRDVSERHRMEQAMLEVAAREQARIGRDLHDTLGQQLAGLSYLSEAVYASLDSHGAPEARDLARISELLQRTVRQTRLIAHNLAAVELAERGLVDALQKLAEESQSVFRVRCDFTSRGTGICPPGTARELHLIATEALNNAVRHGRPRRIGIALSLESRRAVMEIVDDGHWRSPAMEGGGIGLHVMRHRAALAGGRLTVEPLKPHGTRVHCVLPAAREPWSPEGH